MISAGVTIDTSCDVVVGPHDQCTAHDPGSGSASVCCCRINRNSYGHESLKEFALRLAWVRYAP